MNADVSFFYGWVRVPERDVGRAEFCRLRLRILLFMNGLGWNCMKSVLSESYC